MLQFLGHLHPVLVHLPIGILLLACLFMWQSRKDQHENLQPVIRRILFWGMISAVLTCITGYILSQSGDYDSELVSWHQWMGISVAVISILVYYFSKRSSFVKWQWVAGTILLFIVFITGHLGGSLTHGSDYLTGPLAKLLGDDSVTTIKFKPVANIQEAVVYADIVQPVLEGRCYSCHGASKQKGRLRLDQPGLIMKGGKNGVDILPGKSGESEMIKRLLLPRENEHHMAPKEKPQLTTQQVAILQWWIDNGASFTKKVKEFPQTPKINLLLTSLQSGNEDKKNIPDVPVTPIEKADEGAIQKLQELGVVIVPVAQNSNYLEANFVTAKITDKNISLLLPLKKQLVELKAAGLNIGDSSLAVIGQCTNLGRLQLEHTLVTDKGLQQLLSLTHLQSLNLGGTQVTGEGIKKLKSLEQLQHIYLYQSNVNRKDWDELRKLFPKTIIDTGGYVVPVFDADTTIVKEKKK